ncbi:hypothetical protein, partial [Roseovarius aestuarii]|uniref:hypothetical protein n=1 Tax=Roseovarius aestuarii TaxID=475083 RepID=UPI001C38EAFE
QTAALSRVWLVRVSLDFAGAANDRFDERTAATQLVDGRRLWAGGSHNARAAEVYPVASEVRLEPI